MNCTAFKFNPTTPFVLDKHAQFIPATRIRNPHRNVYSSVGFSFTRKKLKRCRHLAPPNATSLVELELPLLPFPLNEVLIPSESKALHFYEARYLALLEEPPPPPPPPPLPQTQLHLPRPQRSLHHRLTFWGVRDDSSSSSSHLFSLPLPFPVAFPSSSPVAAASPCSISIFSLSSCISRFDLDLLQESLHLPAPVCNYAKGKWVVDHKKLLYSGHGCKQCLSSMWSCRMTKCIDFSYEKVSWQPKDCQMEEFEGYKFLKRLYIYTMLPLNGYLCISGIPFLLLYLPIKSTMVPFLKAI